VIRRAQGPAEPREVIGVREDRKPERGKLRQLLSPRRLAARQPDEEPGKVSGHVVKRLLDKAFAVASVIAHETAGLYCSLRGGYTLSASSIRARHDETPSGSPPRSTSVTSIAIPMNSDVIGGNSAMGGRAARYAL
jgi:hypothetical protein